MLWGSRRRPRADCGRLPLRRSMTLRNASARSRTRQDWGVASGACRSGDATSRQPFILGGRHCVEGAARRVNHSSATARHCSLSAIADNLCRTALHCRRVRLLWFRDLEGDSPFIRWLRAMTATRWIDRSSTGVRFDSRSNSERCSPVCPEVVTASPVDMSQSIQRQTIGAGRQGSQEEASMWRGWRPCR